MKRFLLLIVFSHFTAPFLSFSQSTEDFSDETISGETITTNTGLIISSSNLNWSAYTNELNYNSVLLSPPSPYIAPSSNNDFFQITLSDQSKVFSSIEFDLWLNYGGMFGTGDMGCDCKSYTSENQLIETISKSSNEVAKNFIFNSGSIKKIICSPTNVEGGNNLHVDDIIFTIAQQENNNDILLNGTVSAENHQIKNVSDPTDAQDAATKSYVDSNINSFSGSYSDLTDAPTMYTQAQVDALITNLQNQINNLKPLEDVDGNTYEFIKYGDQVWTVENAEMVTYIDGTPIPQVTDNTEWQNLTTGAWSYYNNDPLKPRLYNWYAVMGIYDSASFSDATLRKEFAPEGWHVPSDAEWTTLEEYLIASDYNYDGTTTGNKIAKAMASTTGWISSTETGAIGNDQSLNNSSSFNAFPEGFRSSVGSFYSEGNNALFWSSTESNANSAWSRYLFNDYSNLSRYSDIKQNGFSVRFVRD
jgi:uncharacterized protein (TIGR02145 family)